MSRGVIIDEVNQRIRKSQEKIDFWIGFVSTQIHAMESGFDSI